MADENRVRALSYLRTGRVVVMSAIRKHAAARPDLVQAHITASSGSPVRRVARWPSGAWTCTCDTPGPSCAHRMAVQLVTGYPPTTDPEPAE